jgi:2-dehydro-3-deoxyphosphooctonate aldolase (KDO 8-P synthase)
VPQTNFIQAVAATGKPVNIKKGQFLAPGDMKNVVEKAKAASKADNIMVCERGVSFGTTPDIRHAFADDHAGPGLPGRVHHAFGAATQGQGTSSGGQREFVPILARAAVATGIAGVFMETHPDPAKALSDGPNAWPLGLMKPLLGTLKALDALVKSQPRSEDML